MIYKFNVKKESSGKRLDVFLSANFDKISRSHIQSIIESGEVSINSRVVMKKNTIVKEGDAISVNYDRKKKSEVDLKPCQMDIDILYESERFLVVNKKEGITVHPGCGHSNDTLINGLLYKYKDFGDVGKPRRLGLVHRIDKDTSGIVLVALDNYALWFFSRQFEKRNVEKVYIAIVRGDIRDVLKEDKPFCLSNYLGRNRNNRKKMAVVDKSLGKLATTYFYFLGYRKNSSLGEISIVAAKPKTGRTHQIRVHLKSLGFPIIGDKVYGSCSFKRMLLHAISLRIKMLNGRYKSFRTSVPSAFDKFFSKEDILKKIKGLQ